jgi:RNA polymerase sigma-70 factor (ECF subfamily)
MAPSSSVTVDSARRNEASVQPEGDCSLDTLRERLGQDDAAAFEAIFRRLSEPIFRFVCGMVQDESLAHDLTQDTFARLWSVRDRMDDVDALRPYVYQIARNRVYNQQRDAKVRRDNRAHLQDTHSNSQPPSPDTTLDVDMLRSMIEQWIDELPDRQQEALTLRRQDHLSHDEIAEVMGISPKTVNNHLVRAMKTLRRRLHDHRPDLLS